jgi:predicted phage terminase large subunit-like protein
MSSLNNQTGDLHDFVIKSFKALNPSAEYIDNWHIELICDLLQQITDHKVKRLIINIPPRYLKSTCISVAWPAWLLGNDPSRRIITASYSRDLSIKLSLDTKVITSSDWFKDNYPDFQIKKGQNEKHNFSTTCNGFRLAATMGGMITGFGGDFLIVDDPQNPARMYSKNYRNKAIDWFENAFLSRLDNKKKGSVIIVMQRLHENDLTGHLLKNRSSVWDHVSLPAIAYQDKVYSICNSKFLRKENTALHDARENLEQLLKIKEEIGDYVFSAQYQQNPVPYNSSLFKESWLNYYDQVEKDLGIIYLSWDTAIKASDHNDYSVCTVWKVSGNSYYLLDVFRQKIEYPELVKLFYLMAEKWSPDAILVEDKSSGQALIQEISRNSKLPVIGIKPTKDKITRFASITPLFESSKILLPRSAKWKLDYIQELCSFPQSEHDDQVDSTSQFLMYMKKQFRRKAALSTQV